MRNEVKRFMWTWLIWTVGWPVAFGGVGEILYQMGVNMSEGGLPPRYGVILLVLLGAAFGFVGGVIFGGLTVWVIPRLGQGRLWTIAAGAVTGFLADAAVKLMLPLYSHFVFGVIAGTLGGVIACFLQSRTTAVLKNPE